MKKFFIVLLILILAGGAVFYLGWAQMAVPPGQVGIMISKTNGVYPVLIENGGFDWIWFRLIPKNSRVISFFLPHVDKKIQTKGALPSAKELAPYADTDAPDFSWDIEADISFTLSKNAILPLVSSSADFTADTVTVFANNLSDQISSYVINRLQSYAENEDTMRALLLTGNSDALNRETAAAFPNAEGFTCLVRRARYPDFAQYRLASRRFQAREEALVSAEKSDAAAGSILASRIFLEELAQIGDILNKAPLLLDIVKLLVERDGAMPGINALRQAAGVNTQAAPPAADL